MGMSADFSAYGGQLQSSPVDFAINTSQAAMMNSMSMAPFTMMPTTMDMPNMNAAPFQMADFQQEFTNISTAPDFTANSNVATASVSTGSPGEQWMEIRSLSSSDNGWVDIGHRNSYDFSDNSAIVFNPAQSLHSAQTPTRQTPISQISHDQLTLSAALKRSTSR
jgi:hypothetical protein